MAITKTTSDYRTWAIDINHYTPEETQEYINSISSWDSSEVKIIMISFVDKIVSINGIPAFSSDTDLKSKFEETVGPFEYNSDRNRVAFIGYYADRDTAEVVYDAHPLDPNPRNTKHTGEEFERLFAPIFTWWKDNMLAVIDDSLNNPANAQATFD